MIKSMTGYGKALSETENKKFSIEIKSLNSKQTDINARIPTQYKQLELDLRSIINKRLQRGKIDITLKIEEEEVSGKINLNKEIIRAYFHQLSEISSEINQNINSNELLEIIMQFPEVIKTKPEEPNDNENKQIINTLNRALKELEQFRMQEGAVLEKDFRNRIAIIQQLLLNVASFEKERIKTIKERILKNFTDNKQSVQIDENRFEQELIYYIEKLDITEEKVRLANHLKYFLETLDNPESQGKKLGFIVQEIGREINTLGSKANHTEIQKIVVQMKDELEKIKEQMLNVL